MGPAESGDARSTLGQLVRQHRHALRLTQEELAERAGGISVDTVAAVERGRSRPYRSTMDLICSALELTPSAREDVLAAWREAGGTRGYALAPVEVAPRSAALTAPPPTVGALVGRAADTALLQDVLLRPDVRLVTVTGPGGVGKTSLVLDLVARSPVREAFPDGIAWVDLAPVRRPESVLTTLAAALGFEEGALRPVAEQLVDLLASRTLLLVLDNVEQVVGAAPDLAAVLLRCPQVTALATSRAALRVRGEHLLPLAPLRVAPAEARADPAAVTASPAVQLFAERAQAADPTFDLQASLPAVDAICRRLDGLPLALELAAARVSLFSPDALLERLTSSFDVLASGQRDLPDRQLTLTSTLAWSHDLLTAQERLLLARMAVFADGATVDTVTAACAGPGDPVTPADVPGLLVGLHAQSLVVRDESGHGRMRLLETVREFAREQLGPDELAQARQRHAHVFVDLAEQAAPHLASAERGPWLARLDAERANLRTALAWTATEGTPLEAARLSSALGWWWYFRGPYRAGRLWLADALERVSAAEVVDPLLAATTAWHAGRLAHLQGSEREAQILLSDSAARWRQQPDQVRGLAFTLADLGQVLWYRGRWNSGLRTAREAVELFRQTDDCWGLALALQDLGQATLSSGDRDGGELCYSENLAIFTRLGDQWGCGMAMLGLGRVAMARDRLDEARRLLLRAQAAFRSTGDRRLEAHALNRLGQLERRRGNGAGAASCYRGAFAAWSELGSGVGMALAAAGLAGVAARNGHVERAARLAGSSAALLDAESRRMTPADQSDLAPYLLLTESALGADRYAALLAEGRRWTRDELVAAVLAEPDADDGA